jgi:carbon storage regulator
MIGESVVVTIVDIRGDKVRLGIDAPGEIPVHRQEVYDAIQREKQQRQSGDATSQDTEESGAAESAHTRSGPAGRAV